MVVCHTGLSAGQLRTQQFASSEGAGERARGSAKTRERASQMKIRPFGNPILDETAIFYSLKVSL